MTKTLPEDGYSAAIAMVDELPVFCVRGVEHRARIEVINSGSSLWPGGSDRDPLVRVGFKWLNGAGEEHDAGRAMLPHALHPGEKALVELAILGPPREGAYELVIDLVHEDVRWFGCALRTRTVIAPAIEDQLAELSRTYGPLVPLPAIQDLRRRAARPEALIPDRDPPPDNYVAPCDAGAPADSRASALLERLTLGGWALDTPAIDRLVQLLREHRPSTVVEFGSGTSTLLIAGILAELDKPNSTLISCEQDPAWAEKMRALLTEAGLQDIAHVLHLPLAPATIERPASFAMTDEAESLLRSHPPQLVLVDGPILSSGASRLGTLDLVKPFIEGDALVLLDDALRDAELLIAETWSARSDINVLGIRPQGKGLLEARLHRDSQLDFG
jgi:hypothetical protein